MAHGPQKKRLDFGGNRDHIKLELGLGRILNYGYAAVSLNSGSAALANVRALVLFCLFSLYSLHAKRPDPNHVTANTAASCTETARVLFSA